MAEATSTAPGAPDEGENRRDFLLIATSTVAATGAALTAWPLIDQMNPAADTLALSSIEVDLSPIKEGQAITVVWRKKPVFIRHRSKSEIKTAQAVKLEELPDPEADSKRAEKPKWLILVGICTHLGCIPLGQKSNQPKGEFGGWFCPCHGSHYDTSGRIRKGPAPKNLEVPAYTFVKNNIIKIG